jgi:hypothetical protein
VLGCLSGRLVDNRVFAFVVAKALVTDIEKLRKASPNGQLQPDDILDYFSGELKVWFFVMVSSQPSGCYSLGSVHGFVWHFRMTQDLSIV